MLTDHVTIPTATATALANREWRKSSFSGVQNDCVELAFLPGGEDGDVNLGGEGGSEGDMAAIRDSKAVALGGRPLVLPRAGLTALVGLASR